MALEEDNLPQRPHRKRRLRWGRLVFFIVLLAAVVTAGFWGAVQVQAGAYWQPHR